MLRNTTDLRQDESVDVKKHYWLILTYRKTKWLSKLDLQQRLWINSRNRFRNTELQKSVFLSRND